jgi:hypothetical protein
MLAPPCFKVLPGPFRFSLATASKVSGLEREKVLRSARMAPFEDGSGLKACRATDWEPAASCATALPVSSG